MVRDTSTLLCRRNLADRQQNQQKYHLSWGQFKQYLFSTDALLAELSGLLAAVGLVVGALQAIGMTG